MNNATIGGVTKCRGVAVTNYTFNGSVNSLHLGTTDVGLPNAAPTSKTRTATTHADTRSKLIDTYDV